MDMDRRGHLRIAMDHLSADVSDGVGLFQGMVSDLSRSGIRITDLPKRLNGNVRKMTIVVSDEKNHFKMAISPRWYSEEGWRKSIGAEIINIPWEWTNFVMSFEPAIEKDDKAIFFL
jgi:hypothetical protein